MEDLDENVVVEHLDANVAIESSCDQGRSHGETVSSCLEVVFADAQVRRVHDILALVGVPVYN